MRHYWHFFYIDRRGRLKRKGFEKPWVKLRVYTFNLILNCLTEDQKYKAGKEVGTTFMDGFIRAYGDSDFEALPTRKRVKIWQKDERDSGMGKFECTNMDDPLHGAARIKISHAFTLESTTKPTKNCNYLSGYLAGVFSRIINTEIKCEEVNCAKNSPDGKEDCVFKLEHNVIL